MMNLIERKTGVERPLTARSEQNYSHVTELICSQEGNTGSSRSRRKMMNLTVISVSSGAVRSCRAHEHVITNVFLHCVKMLLGCFDYIVIFLFKILTHLSSFGVILCSKKRRLKYYIACTVKHVHMQYKQNNLRGWFFMAHSVYCSEQLQCQRKQSERQLASTC